MCICINPCLHVCSRYKMSGELPLLSLRISDDKLRSVLELVESIPLPESRPAAQGAASSSAKVKTAGSSLDFLKCGSFLHFVWTCGNNKVKIGLGKIREEDEIVCAVVTPLNKWVVAVTRTMFLQLLMNGRFFYELSELIRFPLMFLFLSQSSSPHSSLPEDL